MRDEQTSVPNIKMNMSSSLSEAMPRISVITPSYNQARYLQQTIDSVLSQNYSNLEYLILDGGSTDHSVDIIKEYQDRLAYWRSCPDDGQAAAIVEGMEKSTGDILCWLNSDDVFLPGSLLKVANWFTANSQSSAIAGGAYRIDSNGDPFPIIPRACTLGARGTTERLIYYGQDGIWQPATFWRREAYFACGGVDVKIHYAMDRDFFIRLSQIGEIDHFPEMLAVFREHEAAKTTKLRDKSIKENKELETRYKPFNNYFYSQMMYWRYRFPAYLSKLFIMYLRVTGHIRLTKIGD